MNPTKALELAREAVGAAIKVTKALQDKLPSELAAKQKIDSSPVTVADFAVQAIVGKHLNQSFVGEESPSMLRADPELRAKVLEAAQIVYPSMSEGELLETISLGEGEPSHRFWTLDPVDGTKGFLRGAHYCIALALIEEGKPTVGVMGCPRLSPNSSIVDGPGAILWATQGESAHIASLTDEGHPDQIIALATQPWSDDKLVHVTESAEAKHSDHSLGPKLLEAAGVKAGPPVRLDSQVKYAVVARGQSQVLLRKPKEGYVEKIWDHAAGSLIAETAGCTVSDLKGQPLNFSLGTQLTANNGVLVAPSTLHPKLLKAFEMIS